MRAWPALLFAAAVFAGCTEGPEPQWEPGRAWFKDPCDPTPGAAPSGNAPRAAPFDQPLSVFVKRFTDALGEPLKDRAAPHPSIHGDDADGQTFWVTTHGVLWARHDADVGTWFVHESERVWPSPNQTEGRAELDALVKAFDWTDVEVDYQVEPISDGIGWQGRYWLYQKIDGVRSRPFMEGWVKTGELTDRFRSSFELRPVHEISDSGGGISTTEAEKAATAYVECLHPGVNATAYPSDEAALVIAHDSVAFQIHVGEASTPGCHHLPGILVDRETKAILGTGGGMSICVD